MASQARADLMDAEMLDAQNDASQYQLQGQSVYQSAQSLSSADNLNADSVSGPGSDSPNNSEKPRRGRRRRHKTDAQEELELIREMRDCKKELMSPEEIERIKKKVQASYWVVPGSGGSSSASALGLGASTCLLYTSPSPRDRG